MGPPNRGVRLQARAMLACLCLAIAPGSVGSPVDRAPTGAVHGQDPRRAVLIQPVRAASAEPATPRQLITAPKRIISVIPAATEMLFAFGAGPSVVGVGTFDHYPAAVERLPKVGALIDPDVEKILSLRPDLVVVYASQSDLQRQLARAGIPVFLYQHAGLADVTKTLRDLATRTGHELDGARVASAIERKLDGIRARLKGAPRPRTLLVFGRERLALRAIYASGGVGFLADMLEIAGGENVFADVRQQAVQATTELILARRPDVILEVRSGNSALPIGDRGPEIAVWNALSSIPAVRNGRIDLLVDERLVVPGPRVAEGTELLARALHPEAFR